MGHRSPSDFCGSTPIKDYRPVQGCSSLLRLYNGSNDHLHRNTTYVVHHQLYANLARAPHNGACMRAAVQLRQTLQHGAEDCAHPYMAGYDGPKSSTSLRPKVVHPLLGCCCDFKCRQACAAASASCIDLIINCMLGLIEVAKLIASQQRKLQTEACCTPDMMIQGCEDLTSGIWCCSRRRPCTACSCSSSRSGRTAHYIAACLCNRRQAERATCQHMLALGGRHMSIMDCTGTSWTGP